MPIRYKDRKPGINDNLGFINLEFILIQGLRSI
jgi:hypothetical protein